MKAALSKLLATAGPLGSCPKGPGTVGSLLGLLIAVAAGTLLGPSSPLLWFLLAAATGLAIAVSTVAERALAQHDPGCIVIDEVVGMWLVVALAPFVVDAAWEWILFAFALFRLFDILKPFPIKRLALAPEGWGIVLDDLGAAVYAAAVLWAAHAGLPRG